jgi:hypothetical protein
VNSHILEETGYFWWSDVAVPQGQWAPETSIAGKLSIDDTGRIRLELDGVLPNKHGPMAAFADPGMPLPPEKGIHGLLKVSNKFVLLSELYGNGGRFHSNGISYERYAALHCLTCDGPSLGSADSPRFTGLEVEMTGFEEWLRLGNFTSKRTKSRITAQYKAPKDISYPLDDGRLEVKYGLVGPYPGVRRDSKLSITEFAKICLFPKNSSSLTEMKDQYALLVDFFILLTGSDYSPGFPMLIAGRGKRRKRFQFYFPRNHSSASEPPAWHECWTNFLQLRETFGVVFSTWRERRQQLGRGIYLFLGTRRGMQLYEEHRFVMLIWGLESLHRRRAQPARGSEKLQAKINRIVSQIELPKDNKWLERQLEHAGEPSLEQRIFETFRGLPLDIKDEPLRKFAKDCADKRNDISHHGGQRNDENYGDAVKDLHKKSEALTYLYQVLLLREIGVDDEILKFDVYRSFFSYRIKVALVEVGLLLPEVLKDLATEAASAAARAAGLANATQGESDG